MRVRKVMMVSAVGLLTAAMASSAHATEQFGFLINGDTYGNPFTITNDSTAGEKVTRFQLDLSPVANLGFDIIDIGDPGDVFGGSNGKPFTLVSEGGTGFLGVNSIPDGGTLLDATFNNFGPGKSFQFNIDVDFDPGNSTVYGDDMIGALGIIDFDSGVRLQGELQAVPGNPNASTFTVTGKTTIPPTEPPVNVVPTPTAWAAGLMTLGGLFVLRRRLCV